MGDEAMTVAEGVAAETEAANNALPSAEPDLDDYDFGPDADDPGPDAGTPGDEPDSGGGDGAEAGADAQVPAGAEAQEKAALVEDAVRYANFSVEEANQLAEAGLLRGVLERIAMSWQANAQQDAENAQDAPAEPEQDSRFVDAVQAIADDEEFDDRIRGMAGTMVDAFKAMRQELDGLKSMRGYYEDMQRQQMAQHVDQTFASLGDNYAELFGTGTRDEVSKNPTQFQNRLRVLGTANGLMRDASTRGQALSFEDAIGRAVWAEFGPQLAGMEQNNERQRLQSQLKAHGKRIIAPPTHRNATTPKTGVEAARSVVRSKLQAMGLPTDSGADDDDDL